MGWKIALGDVALREDDLTAGQWETIYLLANQGLRHNEDEIRPAHCPSCRNACAIVALVSQDPSLGLEGATLLISSLPRERLLDALVVEEVVPVEEPVASGVL